MGGMMSYTPRLILLAAIMGFGLLGPNPAMARSGAKARKIARHHISIKNLHTKKEIEGLRVIRQAPQNPNRQWVDKKARRKITGLMSDWRTGRSKRVPTRLVWYLYLVAQHFDAPIDIVSGYRHEERKSSRHKKGSAIDFRVRGVPPKKVWKYCKRFDNVGLGWYPNSRFVHLDVRKRSYYWVDDSGPGEDAEYRDDVAQRRQPKRKKRK